MKFVKRILPIFMFVFVITTCFVGCKPKSEIALASKNLDTYNIEASLDDETKTVKAVQTVKFTNRNEVSLTKLCFHLYGNAFSETEKIKPYDKFSLNRCFPNGENFGYTKIVNIVCDEQPLNYVIAEDNQTFLQVDLPREFFPAESIEIKISFETKLAECTHRLGYYENTINLGNWYPILCEFENGEFDKDAYYSVGDPFYSSCANYNVKFSYPNKYKIANTGFVNNVSEENGIVVTQIEAKIVRDFALVLGLNYELLSGEVGKTIINIFAYAGDSANAYYLETAKKAVEFFNEKFGNYPYEKLDVVITKFLHGGMEYPNLVMISDSLGSQDEMAKVIVHEIAHQWWYGTVGNDEVENSWLDESMAEYSTVMFYENYPEYENTRNYLISSSTQSYLLYTDVVATTKLQINNRIDLATYEYSGEYEYIYMVYVKGMLMIDSLRIAIGDNAFFSGIKNYYKDNKFKIATKDNFVVAFENTSGLNLEEFFESWLSGSVVIG